MPTIKSIAEKTGVSSATVSIVLNDPGTTRVSHETKQLILEAAKTLNYRKNVIAHALSRRRTNVVGLLVMERRPVFNVPFLREILCGIQDVLFHHGYTIVFLSSQANHSTASIQKQLQTAFGYDALLLLDSHRSSQSDTLEHVNAVVKSRIPFVIVGGACSDGECDSVANQINSANGATEHLLSSGHRRILLLSGFQHSRTNQILRQEYAEAHTRNQCTVDPNLILHTDLSREDARSAVMQALNQGLSFSAVQCSSDAAAVGVYEAAGQAHLLIPDQLSVVGRDDLFFSSFMSPPLTTVRTHPTELGRQAAKRLINILQGDTRRKNIEVPIELVVRHSTRVTSMKEQE